LALCQVGRGDEALAALEGVDNPTPYLCSVRSLARALTADPSGSIDDADQVIADGGASYLDQVVAGTASAAAQMQLGAREAAVDSFRRAHVTASEAGDVVARELVVLTRSVVLSEGMHQELGHLGAGWKLVAASLGSLVEDRPGEPVP